MNRRQRITISITGIFLVLLLLTGLTYGFYVTNVLGNTNEKSISITTTNLELEYNDGDGQILSSDTVLYPSADAINSKTFSVVNKGELVDYVVTLDNVNITKDGIQTNLVSNDFAYTLTCLEYDKDEYAKNPSTSTSTKCEGVETQTMLPLKEEGILIGNIIPKDKIQVYTFTLWYLETNQDQSADMGKRIQARINIKDIKKLDNPYEENTLAYNIINNSLNATNGTQLRATPLTSPKKGVSNVYNINLNEDETEEFDINYYETNSAGGYCVYDDPVKAQMEYEDYRLCHSVVSTPTYSDFVGKYFYTWDAPYLIYEAVYVESYNAETNKFIYRTYDVNEIPEKTLSIAEDDYGTSYYYRGDVEDNYVSFAGFTWRIVRINGDGSIRLILNNAISSEMRDGEYIYKNPALVAVDDNISTPFEINDGLLQYYWQGIPLYMYGNYPYGSQISYNALHQNTVSSILKDYLDVFYEEYILDYEDYLSDTLFCGDKSLATDYSKENYTESDYYSAFERLSHGGAGPTLECAKGADDTYSRYTTDSKTTTKNIKVNSDLIHPIALLSADELVYAGAFNGIPNDNYYLSGVSDWWTLTPVKSNRSNYGSAFVANASNNSLSIQNVYLEYSREVRPVINLKSTVKIQSGNGTSGSPYVLKPLT